MDRMLERKGSRMTPTMEMPLADVGKNGGEPLSNSI